MASIFSWSLIDGNRLARIMRRYLKSNVEFTTSEFIAAAEQAAKDHPYEWVIFYALADKYHDRHQYAEALPIAERCVQLRPKDIRSAYALATSYNVLTRAAWTDKHIDRACAVMSMEEALLSRNSAQLALEQLEMTVSEAGTLALQWFERALDLKPDAQSRATIERDILTLKQRLPGKRWPTSRMSTTIAPKKRWTPWRIFITTLAAISACILISMLVNLCSGPSSPNHPTSTRARAAATVPRPASTRAQATRARATSAAVSSTTNCILWSQATWFIGNERCICGTVTFTKNHETSGFIHFSKDKDSFYAVMVGYQIKPDVLEGECVQICGTIEENYGRPRISITDPDNQVFRCP